MCSLQAGDDYLKYPARWDFTSPFIDSSCEEPALAAAGTRTTKMHSNKSVPCLESSRKMHRRTPSTSTASSGSLKTEIIADWWEESSPWAWQWAGVNDYQK